MSKKLEAYKLFPYVSWALIFSIAFGIYVLTKNLTERSVAISERTIYLENAVKDPNNI